MGNANCSKVCPNGFTSISGASSGMQCFPSSPHSNASVNSVHSALEVVRSLEVPAVTGTFRLLGSWQQTKATSMNDIVQQKACEILGLPDIATFEDADSVGRSCADLEIRVGEHTHRGPPGGEFIVCLDMFTACQSPGKFIACHSPRHIKDTPCICTHAVHVIQNRTLFSCTPGDIELGTL